MCTLGQDSVCSCVTGAYMSLEYGPGIATHESCRRCACDIMFPAGKLRAVYVSVTWWWLIPMGCGRRTVRCRSGVTTAGYQGIDPRAPCHGLGYHVPLGVFFHPCSLEVSRAQVWALTWTNSDQLRQSSRLASPLMLSGREPTGAEPLTLPTICDATVSCPSDKLSLGQSANTTVTGKERI